METVIIKQPIWGGGNPKFGIASYRLRLGQIQVKCSYKNKAGELTFPHTYRISCKKAKTYPCQRVRGGVNLHVIPVSDFEILD